MKNLYCALALISVLMGCAVSDRPLQLLSGAGAIYPAQAKAAGIEGTVDVEYGVTTDGRVIDARVVASQPAQVFDEAALVAVRQWHFQAPIVDGQPQAVERLRSTVRFQLSGAERYEEFDQ